MNLQRVNTMNSPRIYTATYNGTEYTNDVKFFSNLICKSETYVRKRIKYAFEEGHKRPMQFAIDDYVANFDNTGKRNYPAGRRSVKNDKSEKQRGSNQALFASNNNGLISNFLYPRKTQIVEKREHITCQAQ